MVDVTLRELLATARVVNVPLTVPFRSVTSRTSVIISGPRGFGEFAPFAEYGAQESSWWLQSAVEAAWCGWPRPARARVGVNAIIPALPPTPAATMAARAEEHGYRTLKVKVAGRGMTLTDDLHRLEAIRTVFTGQIRLDANGGWTRSEAIAAIHGLTEVAGELQYVEQPCADRSDFAAVKQATGVKIAADETIRRADDHATALLGTNVDVIILKVPPLGGVRTALQLAALAPEYQYVVSSAMDTSVGLAAGVALAAALPSLEYDCGLGTGDLLADDICPETARPTRGWLTPYQPQLSQKACLRAERRVSADERERMLSRLSQAWDALLQRTGQSTSFTCFPTSDLPGTLQT